MKKSLHRLLAALVALSMLLGCAALAEPAEAVDEVSVDYVIEGMTYPYLRQFTEEEKYPKEDVMNLYFVNGGDIPYVALSEYMAFLSGLLKDMEKGEITYEINYMNDDGEPSFTVSRPDNDSTLYIYPERDCMIFDNFNTFTQTVGTKALVSTMDMPEADEIDPVAYVQGLLGLENMDSETQEQVEGIIETENQDAPAEDEDAPAEDEDAPAEDEDAPAEDGDAPAEDAPAEDAPAEDAPAEDAPTEADAGNATPSLFSLKTRMYVNRAGDIITLDLSNYGIDIVEAEGECFIPFQTMNDLLVCDTYMQYVFDGEKVLGFAYGCSLMNELDSSPKRKMSEEFARFNYNELRLLLDCKYGLKPEHGIDDFDTFLSINTGLWYDLSNTDAMRANYALVKLLYMYFDDLHSGFIRGSYMVERNDQMDQLISGIYLGPSIRKSESLRDVYWNARKEVFRAWVPGYEEVGDTAFITFDEFSSDRENYYDPMIDRDDPKDTIDLIIYANSQIKREGSPVKNIVLDLSNNGGGSASAAIFVISWFLGDADIALRDTFTGAETNAIYVADVNLDGQFDGADDVSTGYKLYCLTTNSSFSCGNLVPAACRSSGKVTMVGQTSGGGACVVLPCTTAAGTVFQISGNRQISIIKNGSFYNADTGIEPDFTLDKPESFYDRPALVEYLHNLK